MKHSVKRALNRLGVDIVRYPNNAPGHRRSKLLRQYDIGIVFDVGANAGQYAEELRRHGYDQRIVSFEPLTEAYRTLEKRAARDPLWTTVNVALGEEAGKGTINVSGNSYSSSMLDMLPAHTRAAPESAYVGHQTVDITTIDDVFGHYSRSECKAFLKIDAQGFERQVLRGASASIARLAGVQLEMSLVMLYEGSMLLPEAMAAMGGAGFSLMSIELGVADDSTGQLLQCDGVFLREGKLSV